MARPAKGPPRPALRHRHRSLPVLHPAAFLGARHRFIPHSESHAGQVEESGDPYRVRRRAVCMWPRCKLRPLMNKSALTLGVLTVAILNVVIIVGAGLPDSARGARLIAAMIRGLDF